MDMNKLQEKYQKLLSYLKELDSVAIAFSRKENPERRKIFVKILV